MTKCEIYNCDTKEEIDRMCALHYAASKYNREDFQDALGDVYNHHHGVYHIAVDPETEEQLYQCLGCSHLYQEGKKKSCGCLVGSENAFALGDYEKGEDYIMKEKRR